MSRDTSSGGANASSGGTSAETSNHEENLASSGNPGEVAPANPDSVKYDTFLKVLNEKKARDRELSSALQKLQELEAKEKDRELQEATAKGDLQKLLKLREEEISSVKTRLQSLEGQLEKGAKLSAVLSHLSGEVEDQYFGLIDVSQVVIDPATGLPDETSAQKAASLFEQRYSKVITRPSGVAMPNHAAKGAATQLSYADWKKLPLEEMKKRMKDVDPKSY